MSLNNTYLLIFGFNILISCNFNITLYPAIFFILQFLFNICEISIDLYGSNPFSVLQNIPVCKYTVYSVAENVGGFQLSWYLKQYLTHGVCVVFFWLHPWHAGP